MGWVLTFFGAWTFDPVVAFCLIAAGGAYLRAVRTVAKRRPATPWPRRYTAWFLSGLAATWLFLLGPFGAYDDVFFWAHMMQHLGLMMVAAPLLVLGAPVLLLLRVSVPRVRHRYLLPVLRSRVMIFLTHPSTGWLLYTATIVGTHFSPFYDYALRHPLVHDYIEHPMYFTAALVYYYPLLSPRGTRRTVPYWLRAVSLIFIMIPETMSGFFIYAANYVMYPFYQTVSRPFGPGPLEDQQLGGALMWAGNMVIGSVWVTLAVAAWLRSEERRAYHLDLQTLADNTLPVRRQ